MNDRLSFRILVVMGLALGGLLGSCGDDPVIDESRSPGPNGPGGLVSDGGTDGGSLCPPGEPKVGEMCPSTEESQLRCTYVVGTCQFGGTNYDVTLDYCCQRGVLWESCGTNSTPCDREVIDAPVAPPPSPDAGAGG